MLSKRCRYTSESRFRTIYGKLEYEPLDSQFEIFPHPFPSLEC